MTRRGKHMHSISRRGCRKWGPKGFPSLRSMSRTNRTFQGNGYPACVMSGAEMATLIKTYIGPQFKTGGLTTQIWLGTLQSALDGTSFYHEFIPPALGDAATNAFITGVSMQWNAIDSCGAVTQNYPSKESLANRTTVREFLVGNGVCYHRGAQRLELWCVYRPPDVPVAPPRRQRL
jgi:hypothetical protein